MSFKNRYGSNYGALIEHPLGSDNMPEPRCWVSTQDLVGSSYVPKPRCWTSRGEGGGAEPNTLYARVVHLSPSARRASITVWAQVVCSSPAARHVPNPRGL
jgi:hypothetical protein